MWPSRWVPASDGRLCEGAARAAEELSRRARAGGVLLHLLGEGAATRWTAGGQVQALLTDGRR
ncbi:MAG: hypothetical protein AB7N76_12410 [Planctomycetota bacterium]